MRTPKTNEATEKDLAMKMKETIYKVVYDVMPNTLIQRSSSSQCYKPPVLLVGHAFDNNEHKLRAHGFDLGNLFGGAVPRDSLLAPGGQ